jgi:hypothetical protein
MLIVSITVRDMWKMVLKNCKCKSYVCASICLLIYLSVVYFSDVSNTATKDLMISGSRIEKCLERNSC